MAPMKKLFQKALDPEITRKKVISYYFWRSIGLVTMIIGAFGNIKVDISAWTDPHDIYKNRESPEQMFGVILFLAGTFLFLGIGLRSYMSIFRVVDPDYKDENGYGSSIFLVKTITILIGLLVILIAGAAIYVISRELYVFGVQRELIN